MGQPRLNKIKGISGKRFGRLVALYPNYLEVNGTLERDKDGSGSTKWVCKCDCGKIAFVSVARLGAGTQSCGCLSLGIDSSKNHRERLEGKQFGLLTVLEQDFTKVGKGAHWKCRCACGSEKVVISSTYSLKSGSQWHCGCKHRSKYEDDGAIACFNGLYRRYQKTAEDYGREFSLTKDEFRYLTNQPCFFCGKEPSQKSKGTTLKVTYIYTGIDRKDNTKGYTPENSIPCCKVCNSMKSDSTYEEFLRQIEKIYLRRVSANKESKV